jgi:citrate synthase
MAGMSSPIRGLDGVVAVRTQLSHVDGQRGALIVRGYPVEELAGKVTFEEAAYLLWNGRLPDRPEADALYREIAALRPIPQVTMALVVEAAKRGVPAMDVLRIACATLSLDVGDANAIAHDADVASAKMLVARFPTIVAAYVRVVAGHAPIAPRADLPLAANFLHMTSGSEPDPVAARALEAYWVTVMDHGLNASTFTARVIASTRSDMVSAVTGAIGALKGPLHGGAPGPVLDMLLEIGTRENAERWVREELAAGRRIMGFGHRVYKVRDPRAEVLAKVAAGMSGAALQDRALFELARDVEKTVLRVLDEVKPGRNLKTNVEFYTALVLQSIGLKPAVFSAVFACGRCAGWCAHVIEQHAEDHLIRPDSEYIGPRGWDVQR